MLLLNIILQEYFLINQVVEMQDLMFELKWLMKTILVLYIVHLHLQKILKLHLGALLYIAVAACDCHVVSGFRRNV